MGGSIVAGMRAALSSPFLLAICGYLFCYTALSTALYFQQVTIVKDALPDPAQQTRFFARIDLLVNSLTLLVQLLAFSRLAALMGPTGLLVLMPVVSVAGFLWLGATPTLLALVVFGVTRRVGEFAISKPAREALFTAVPREERYKAKNFIDTVVYRGGDLVAAWSLASVPALLAAGIALGWTALGAFLGTRMKSWTRDDARSSRSLQPGR
jgi:AAA family ATP:ADP antiporter